MANAMCTEPIPMDAEQWTYRVDDEHYVEVKLPEYDEYANGGKFWATYRDDAGDNLEECGFRINSVDRRELVADVDDVSQPIIQAIHAGRWEITNLPTGKLPTGPSDPPVVQLLDTRDHFESMAAEADGQYNTELYSVTARLMEDTMINAVKMQMVVSDAGD